jgi:hypothetical protein
LLLVSFESGGGRLISFVDYVVHEGAAIHLCKHNDMNHKLARNMPNGAAYRRHPEAYRRTRYFHRRIGAGPFGAPFLGC